MIKFKRAILICSVRLGCVSTSSAEGIYTTGIAVTNSAPSGFRLECRFEPSAGIQGFGFTNFLIDPNLSLLFNGTLLAGPQPLWKLVDEGSVVDRDPNGFGPFLGSGNQPTLDQPFLIGLKLQHVPSLGPVELRFGWARLRYTAAGMQLLDQAVAFDGFGIIAGTTTVVPEPSTICLAASAAMALVWYCRRCSKSAIA